MTYNDLQPLNHFGAAMEKILDARGMSLEELADRVTEAGYRVEPSLISMWMVGWGEVDWGFVRTLRPALALDDGEAGEIAVAEVFKSGEIAGTKVPTEYERETWLLHRYLGWTEKWEAEEQQAQGLG